MLSPVTIDTPPVLGMCTNVGAHREARLFEDIEFRSLCLCKDVSLCDAFDMYLIFGPRPIPLFCCNHAIREPVPHE